MMQCMAAYNSAQEATGVLGMGNTSMWQERASAMACLLQLVQEAGEAGECVCCM
jgi:hypothetical protein